jgi:DUF1009 family protein
MIGLIFGETHFPKEILKNVERKKIKHLIIDLTKKNNFRGSKYSHHISIGQFGEIIKILKKNNCNKILFAGKVNKPIFSKIKLDLKGIYYISRIIKSSKLGDAAILKEIINIFKKEKITTINSLFFTPELTLKTGVHTKAKPNKRDLRDIKKGINTLAGLNDYSFSQAVIIKNNKIIAIEGKGGTQKMLQKFKNKENISNGVLVKLPKKKQDQRIDLPTIGLKTIIQSKESGIKGIVLKGNKNIFLEKKKSIFFANKNKMFIKVI